MVYAFLNEEEIIVFQYKICYSKILKRVLQKALKNDISIQNLL